MSETAPALESPPPESSQAEPSGRDERCTLSHAAFAKMGDIVFRLAETDQTPIVSISLGASAAAVPLKALQAELRIADDTADGQMLGLIAKSLDFIGELRLGDKLPVEVLGAGASWEGDPVHRELAIARLRLQVAALLDSGPAAEAVWVRASAAKVLSAYDNPDMKAKQRAAMSELAAKLGLADAAAAAELVEEVAGELSFIEALRDRLLVPVRLLSERATLLSLTLGSNPSGAEVTGRVRYLAGVAHDRIAGRFATIDGQTRPVLDFLREFEVRRDVVRTHRDWLYCTLRAWQPLLAEWAELEPGWSDAAWPLLHKSYRFLAARFLPTQEWQSVQKAKMEGAPTRMVW